MKTSTAPLIASIHIGQGERVRPGTLRRVRLRRALVVTMIAVSTVAITPVAEALRQEQPRARDLGIPFPGQPGPSNAITDVGDVEVGQVTLIRGDGPLTVGAGPVRTGVTAIRPRGRDSEPVFAGWYSLNGNGEMTGTTWVEESGALEGPVMITNTHSVGVVRDAVIDWLVRGGHGRQPWALPVVAETYDGFLNDINGFHVRPAHVFEALDNARGDGVSEGAVGGGTGMTCHGFKCGIGTSSRAVEIQGVRYTIGALVQANYGGRDDLMIAGAPVGREITDLRAHAGATSADAEAIGIPGERDFGSIIVVVATDAPLLPYQLKRIARRVPLGVARMGGMASNGSGDIFIAFSTANRDAVGSNEASSPDMLPNGWLTPLFQATAYAVEEAITNALVAGTTIVGRDGNTVYALPHDRLREVLRRYNRLRE